MLVLPRGDALRGLLGGSWVVIHLVINKSPSTAYTYSYLIITPLRTTPEPPRRRLTTQEGLKGF